MDSNSLKGKKFTDEDLHARVRNTWPEDRRRAYLAAQTDRYKVVATADDGEPLIAEELNQVILNRLSPAARRIAGAMMLASSAVRIEVLRAFETDGNLKNPFK
jgi:hypothetical protein